MRRTHASHKQPRCSNFTKRAARPQYRDSPSAGDESNFRAPADRALIEPTDRAGADANGRGPWMPWMEGIHGRPLTQTQLARLLAPFGIRPTIMDLNFGVVTSFEFQGHPVHTVLGGLILYPRPAANDVIRHFRDYIETARRGYRLRRSATCSRRDSAGRRSYVLLRGSRHGRAGAATSPNIWQLGGRWRPAFTVFPPCNRCLKQRSRMATTTTGNRLFSGNCRTKQLPPLSSTDSAGRQARIRLRR
jgi:hypothetical protein